MKKLLVEHNKTIFHDHEKPLTQTETIVHETSTTCQPVRIPPHRIVPGRRKIIEDEIPKIKQEGTIVKSSGLWCSPVIPGKKERWHYIFLCGVSLTQ